MKTHLSPSFNLRRNFGPVFLWWREQRGHPIKHVATETGYSYSSIKAWENGQRTPKPDTLTNIVNYTGLVPCRFFCGWTGDCSPTRCRFVR
jgi:transcriptional regulator with XRE-family HTH domain